MTDGIQVQVDQLPMVARSWDTSADAMERISLTSQNLTYRLNPGLFAGFVRLYNAVPVEVAQLCGQGSKQMVEIAQAVMASYRNYENAENANTQLTEKL